MQQISPGNQTKVLWFCSRTLNIRYRVAFNSRCLNHIEAKTQRTTLAKTLLLSAHYLRICSVERTSLPFRDFTCVSTDDNVRVKSAVRAVAGQNLPPNWTLWFYCYSFVSPLSFDKDTHSESLEVRMDVSEYFYGQMKIMALK